MSQQERIERLQAELRCMEALQEASSILSFEASGEPPDRYSVKLRGEGLCRDLSPNSAPQRIEEHRFDIRLPYSYPARPPDIRWLTPIFHPNISFGGFLNFRDLGLPWESGLALDVVCQRLWDVARLAYMDMDSASNFAAKSWFERHEMQLPVDARPLRDRAVPTSNVVRYARKGQPPRLPPAVKTSEVLFIGPDTPDPTVPERPIIRPRRDSDDEVFYIGDE